MWILRHMLTHFHHRFLLNLKIVKFRILLFYFLLEFFNKPEISYHGGLLHSHHLHYLFTSRMVWHLRNDNDVSFCPIYNILCVIFNLRETQTLITFGIRYLLSEWFVFSFLTTIFLIMKLSLIPRNSH